MRKNKLKLKNCGKMLAIALLMSFLKCPMFAEPPMEQQPNLNENEMKRYSDLEVNCLAELDLLIDEVSQAALEAIEQAAGEAARAAVLASIEREAEAYREANKWKLEAEIAKKTGIKNAVITGVICFVTGFATCAIIMGVVK